MKVTILAIALVFSGILWQNANAVSLNFSIDVISSGPSIYACDAGIRHDKHPQRVCFDRKSGELCAPAANYDQRRCVEQPQLEECKCVCTGGMMDNTGDGEYRLDFMKATYGDWVDNGERLGALSTKKMWANHGSYQRLFSGDEEWNKILTSLEYDLGSERYGAQMYLDVCYRGPQIEYWQNKPFGSGVNSNPNHNLKAQATVTDIVSNNGLKYSQLADLKVRVDAVCDVQGLGTYVYAHNGNGDYDVVAHTITNALGGGDVRFSYPATGYTNFNANTELLLNTWINYNNANTPRFCKVRYSFIENRRNDTDLLAQIRKWKLHKAQICTYTEIQENAEE